MERKKHEKEKTLPADFEEILKRGDVEEIRNVLEQREADAHKPHMKRSLYCFLRLFRKKLSVIWWWSGEQTLINCSAIG